MTALRFPSSASTAVLLLGAALTASVAAPAAAESADCRRASGPVETAICSTPALTALDAKIAERYGTAIRGYDAASAEALRRDQRAFLAARNTVGARLTGADLIEELTDQLTRREAFLTDLGNDPLVSVVGRWRNLNGEIVVNQWATGVLTFTATAADPRGDGWSCEVDGSGDWIDEDEARFDDISGAAAWSLNVKAQGATLVVKETIENDADAVPYCGAGGTLSGTYFQAVRLPDPSR
nr:lysozyme inhibitor LprI family protein [Brevundimonas diminuta]